MSEPQPPKKSASPRGAADRSKTAEATSKNAEATSKNAEATSKTAEATSKNAEATSKTAEATSKNAEAASKNAEATSKNAEATSKNAEAPPRRRARRLGWLFSLLLPPIGLIGFLLAFFVEVVPPHQRAIRDGLGPPVDLGPGVHFVVRPLHQIARRPALVAVSYGISPAEEQATRATTPSPTPLRAYSADGHRLAFEGGVRLRLLDARVDAPSVVHRQLQAVFKSQPAATWGQTDPKTLAALLTTQLGVSAREEGLQIEEVLVGSLRFESAVEAQMTAAARAQRQADLEHRALQLTQRQAQAEQAQAQAARTSSETQTRYGAQLSEARQEAARRRRAERTRLRTEWALQSAQTSADLRHVQAEYSQLKHQIQAQADRVMAKALSGPGQEAWLKLWAAQRALPERCPPRQRTSPFAAELAKIRAAQQEAGDAAPSIDPQSLLDDPTPYAPAAPRREAPVGQPPHIDENPADDNPADDNPADDNPADDNPADDNPTDDNPTDDNPADDNPADDRIEVQPAQGAAAQPGEGNTDAPTPTDASAPEGAPDPADAPPTGAQPPSDTP